MTAWLSEGHAWPYLWLMLCSPGRIGGPRRADLVQTYEDLQLMSLTRPGGTASLGAMYIGGPARMLMCGLLFSSE